jgi:nucleotide-binding universal stress UspA family protein
MSGAKDGHLGDVLLGDVMTHVVREAPCPVLTLHQPERDFVVP